VAKVALATTPHQPPNLGGMSKGKEGEPAHEAPLEHNHDLAFVGKFCPITSAPLTRRCGLMCSQPRLAWGQARHKVGEVWDLRFGSHHYSPKTPLSPQ